MMFSLLGVLLLQVDLTLSYRVAFLGKSSCAYNFDDYYCPQETYTAQAFYKGMVDGGILANGSVPNQNIETVFLDPQFIIPNITLGELGGELPEDKGRITRVALHTLLNDTSNPVVAVVGLSEDCNQVASLANAYNKAVIMADCSAPVGESNIPMPTAVQLDATQGAKYRALSKLLVHLNWTSVGVINFEFGEDAVMVPEQLFDAFSADNITMAFYENKDYQTSSGLFTGQEIVLETILRTYLKTRIYVLLNTGGSREMRFLAALQSLGLLETGRYFVIVVSSTAQDRKEWKGYSTSRSAIRSLVGTLMSYPDTLIRQMYRHMFVLTDMNIQRMDEDAAWQSFWKTFQESFGTKACPPFCDRKNNRLADNDFSKEYNYNAIALSYDAGLILGQTLIVHGKSINITDGVALAEVITSRIYHSVLGYDSMFDRSGVAQHVFTLWSPQELLPKGAISQWAAKIAELTPDGTGQFTITWQDLASRGVYHAKLPEGVPACGFDNEFCPSRNGLGTVEWIIIIACAIGGLAVLGFMGYVIRWIAYERRLESSYYIVDKKDVMLQDITNFGSSRAGSDIFTSMMSMKSGDLQSTANDGPTPGTMQFYQTNIKKAYRRRNKNGATQGAGTRDMWKEIKDWHLAKFDGQLVTVRKVNKEQLKLTRDMKQELDLLMTSTHDNLCKFHGIIIEPSIIFTIHSFGLRKSLNDLLRNHDLRLDRMFKVSFVQDITGGLRFLHDKCKIGYHGNLKSTNCVVDAYWRVKLNNFGMEEIRVDEPKPKPDDMLWLAPEILRAQCNKSILSKEELARADMYSLAIVLYEIYGRQGPFGDDLLDSTEIVEQLKFPVNDASLTRPDLSTVRKAPPQIIEVIERCWGEEPSERPPIKTIRDKLKQIGKGLKGNIVDNIMELLDRYRYNLEDVMKERTEELEDERRRNESLLLQLLPRTVADSLKNGRPVEAEFYDSITIYFSDIVGFTALSSKSTPMQVVNMLNDLYTEFDNIIDKFDCYKVETIGDAYMYVSGLPDVNGIHHAGEVAAASLLLLERIKTFTVRHCPEERLRLRIGLHSGPVVTGVVGVRMPRYCLFGDTVITASNMESSGEPMKIQLSKDTHKLLVKCGGFEMEPRGAVELKSKSKMESHWLYSYSVESRLTRLKAEQDKYPQFEALLQKAAKESEKQ